jgi:signal-transduction protein with cAMP-binding, CBS, and nucleotidyltransferase domain
MNAMPVSGILSPADRIVTASPDQTVADAAAAMSARNVGSVIVVDGPDHEVVGIMTERDMMARIVACRIDPEAVKVGQVMNRQIESCSPETPICDAQATMARKNIRHLPVLQGGRIVGILSNRDVLLQQLANVQSIGYGLARLVEQFRTVFPTICDPAA